jgi:superfamily II DNA or RNA helicase
MAKKPTLYVRDKMYIPIKMLPMDPEDAVAEYTVHDYDEKICRMCDYKRDRYSDICGECEKGGYKGATVFAKEKIIDGKKHLAFPIGDRLNIERRLRIDLSDFKIKDMRTKAPFDYKVKFIGKLRDYQVDLLKKWVKFKHGLIKAPPRTGKTITSIAICIELGQRVVIMANQVDFLENFMEEIAAHTNLPKLEEKYGKKLFGFLNKPEDYENFQIGFATYQSFISDTNGKRRLKLLQKNFGTLWIDEVHRSSAREFSKLIHRCRMKFKGGCTATDKRKDGMHYRAAHLIGPVVAEVEAPSMVPKMVVHETEFKSRAKYSGPAGFVYATKALSKDNKRNKLILDHIIKDLKKGRSILLTTYYREHVAFLVDQVNQRFGKKVAVAFTGGGTKKNKAIRKQIIDDARAGKVRVVVGIKSLMQLGLNVPKWDTLYYIMPMSNEPNWQQESRRICTPSDDKNDPLIRFFVDPSMGLSMGCFRNTWKFSLAEGHQPTEKSHLKAVALGATGSSPRDRDDDDSDIYRSERNDRSKKAKPKANRPKGIFASGWG